MLYSIFEGFPALAVTGLLVGLLVGMTGMGGGVILTPILLLGFGMPPVHAVATDLVFAAITKIAGAWQHWRLGNINIRVAKFLAIGSLPATIFAVILLQAGKSSNLNATEFILKRLIGFALLAASISILAKVLGYSQATFSPKYPERFPAAIILIGAIGGLLVGLTSVGSGSLILALVVLFIPLSAAELVGTDVLHGAALVSVAAVAHLFFGNADLTMVGHLLVGSIPGVIIGSRLSPRLPKRFLQIGLAGILALTAISMLMPK